MCIVRRVSACVGILLFLLSLSGCDLLLGIQVVSDPIFSHTPGVYDESIVVSLSTGTEGATIRYTLDSSVPSETHGTVYEVPIGLTEEKLIRAIAYKDGYTPSNVVEGLFTVSTLPVSDPTFYIPGGSYVGRQLVEIESTTDDAIIRYTLDGNDPSPTSGHLYTTALAISRPCTLKAIAYKDGHQTSAIASTTFDITYSAGSIGPGGGYVFFDKGTLDRDIGTYDPGTGTWTKTGVTEISWRYLEVAPSSSEGAGNNWGGEGTGVVSNVSALGGGWMNTINIISEFGETDPDQNRSDYAASFCYYLSGVENANISNEWYLPSRAELSLLYDTLYLEGLGDFVDDMYWSSTSMEDNTAYVVDFYSGTETFKRRYEYHRVRAIRAF